MDIHKPKVSRQKVIYLDRYQKRYSNNNTRDHVTGGYSDVFLETSTQEPVIPGGKMSNFETCTRDSRIHNEWLKVEEKQLVDMQIGHKEDCYGEYVTLAEVDMRSHENESNSKYLGVINCVNQNDADGLDSSGSHCQKYGCSVHRQTLDDLTSEQAGSEQTTTLDVKDSQGISKRCSLPTNGIFNVTGFSQTKQKQFVHVDPFSDTDSILSTEVNKKDYFNKLKEFEREIRQPGKPVVEEKRRSSDQKVSYSTSESITWPELYKCSSAADFSKVNKTGDNYFGKTEDVQCQRDISASLEDIIQDFLSYFQSKRQLVFDENMDVGVPEEQNVPPLYEGM